MNEIKLGTNRWPSRVLSPDGIDPLNIPDGANIVTVHPGWQKQPEIMELFLGKLAKSGFFPLAVDTRSSYADNADSRFRMRVGSDNQYFQDADRWSNCYFHRRPTALLHILEELGISATHFIGHSEGARIGAVAATADNSATSFKSMVMVNGVGTGEVGGPVDLLKSNFQTVREIRSRRESAWVIGASAVNSTLHFATHLRRSIRERNVISEFEEWFAENGAAVAQNVGRLAVVCADDDYLISGRDIQPLQGVDYSSVDGGHSSMYDEATQDWIIQYLLEDTEVKT